MSQAPRHFTALEVVTQKTKIGFALTDCAEHTRVVIVHLADRFIGVLVPWVNRQPRRH